MFLQTLYKQAVQWTFSLRFRQCEHEKDAMSSKLFFLAFFVFASSASAALEEKESGQVRGNGETDSEIIGELSQSKSDSDFPSSLVAGLFSS